MRSKTLHNVGMQNIELELDKITQQIARDEASLRQIRNQEAKRSSTSSWQDSYKRLELLGEAEEIKTKLETNQNRFDLLKKQQKKRNEQQEQMVCCSSHSRDCERKVVNMGFKERLQMMKDFRSLHGNRCFEKKEYEVALKWYEKSLLFYEYCLPQNKIEQDQIDLEQIRCCVNSAACYLNLKNYKSCIEMCDEALDIPAIAYEHNATLRAKALLRRANAYRYLYEFDQADRDLQDAQSSCRCEQEKNYLEKEMKHLEKAKACYNKNSSVVAKRMLV